MKNLLVPILELIKGKYAPYILGGIFFIVALLWVKYGLINTIFVLLMTLVGYTIGYLYFTDSENLKELIDKIFPPGSFR